MEYDKVEMYLVEVMTGGVVMKGQNWQDVVQTCFDRFAAAKATVLSNKPSFYSISATGSDVGSDGVAVQGPIPVDVVTLPKGTIKDDANKNPE